MPYGSGQDQKMQLSYILRFYVTSSIFFFKYEFSYFYKLAKSCPIRKSLGMLLTSESDISLILPIIFNYDLIDLAS